MNTTDTPLDALLDDRDESQPELVYALAPDSRLGWASVQLMARAGQTLIQRHEQDFRITATHVEFFTTTATLEWNADTLRATLEELERLQPQARIGLAAIGPAGERLRRLRFRRSLNA